MNLERMLALCHRDQWRIDDLDWSVAPAEMSRDKEEAVVQYFLDMAAIERLAKALFAEQHRRATDPVLKEIFATFVSDEERHAKVAERLAAHYDAHGYRRYQTSEALLRFQPFFLDAIRRVSPEIANVYITAGELLLDVALLRSLDDYVDDAMSNQAMELINRDESRHIAVDYYMVQHYSSDDYVRSLEQRPRRGLVEGVRATRTFATMLLRAKPFFRDVFFEPMQRADPQGRRLREAIKRLQLLGERPEVAARPFAKFLIILRRLYNDPLARRALGPLLSRAAGVPGELLMTQFDADEAEAARRMSYDELARDALAAKFLH